MQTFETFNWGGTTPQEHLAVAQGATDAQLCRLARMYDWRLYPEMVLGWIMAQRAIDLGSALTCFLNGEPERFNYLSKRQVPDQHRSAARVLDNICLRINSGFYLAEASIGPAQTARLENWLTYQAVDRRERRRGRWILDEAIIDPLLTAPRPAPARDAAAPAAEAGGVMHRLLRPLPTLGGRRKLPGGASTPE